MTRPSDCYGSVDRPSDVPSVELAQILHAIAEQAPVMLWLSRERNRRDWFNRSWLEFTGLRSDDDVGARWTERVHPEDLESYLAGCAECFDAQRAFSRRVRLRRHDGVYRVCLETASPFHAPDGITPGGAFVGLLGACVDATEQAEAEKQLRQREALISTLAHDLRSPLNAMLGWAQLLRSDPTHEPRHLEEGLEVFERNARLQSRLVADLADANRLVSGKTHLARRSLPLRGLVSAAVEASAASAAARGIRIQERLPGDDVRIDADPERLRKALGSLLAHTVSLAPDGGVVEVEAGRTADGVEIRIARELSPCEAAASSEGPGRLCGSELVSLVVLTLVELHGGTLRASQEGSRCASVVSLPAAEPIPAR